MVERLRAQTFAACHLGDVQDFFCGNNPWHIEVAKWIKGDTSKNSALRDIASGKNEVWLYRTTQGAVVGYGSLGKTKWRWPPPQGQWEIVSIIPFIGIKTEFQGQPHGVPSEERFASQIMGDLIGKARGHGTRILGLFVHRDNARAIKFYNRIGFLPLRDDGKENLRMFLDLGSLADLVRS